MISCGSHLNSNLTHDGDLGKPIKIYMEMQTSRLEYLRNEELTLSLLFLNFYKFIKQVKASK